MMSSRIRSTGLVSNAAHISGAAEAARTAKPFSFSARATNVRSAGSSSTSRMFGAVIRQTPLLASLRPLDLFEFQLDRRRATEDGNRHLDPAAVEVEFLDDAIEAGERAVQHLDLIADLVIDLDLGLGCGGGGF